MKQLSNLDRHSLHLSLNFEFNKAGKFILYRRMDDREFRFCKFDGRGYDDFVVFLQYGQPDVHIPPAEKLKTGWLYNINGRGKFTSILLRAMPEIVAMNNFLMRQDLAVNLLVNFEVVRYVLANYPGFVFKSVCDMNCQINERYDSVEKLEQVPADSFYRTHLVWLAVERPCRVNVAAIPDDIFDSYTKALFFQEEYATFSVGDKVGLKAWGIKELLPPVYQRILLTNFSAYIQDETGMWAEYGCLKGRFRSKFIYQDVEIEREKGLVTASFKGKRIVLRSSTSSPAQVIEADESGRFGVRKDGKWVITPEFDCVSVWKDTGWYEVFKEGCYGLYSSTGDCILPCVYDSIEATVRQPELFKVCQNDQWGIVGTGGRVYHALDIPDGETEALEAAYREAVLTYIRECYKQHRVLPATVLNTNPEHDYILVGLRTCELTFSVRKEHLPEGLYDKCKTNYWTATKYLSHMVLFATDNGKVRFNYEQTQTWLKYKRNLRRYRVGMSVLGEVRATEMGGYTVRMVDGVFGHLVSTKGQSYAMRQRLTMRIDRIEGDELYLSELTDSHPEVSHEA